MAYHVSLPAVFKVFSTKPVPSMWKLQGGNQILHFQQHLDMANQMQRLPDKHAWRIAGMMPNPCQTIVRT